LNAEDANQISVNTWEVVASASTMLPYLHSHYKLRQARLKACGSAD